MTSESEETQDNGATEAYDRIIANLRKMLDSTSNITRKEFDRALKTAGSSLDEASEFTRNEIDKASKAVRKDWRNLVQAVNKQKDTLLQSEGFQRFANTSLDVLGKVTKSIKDLADEVDDTVDEQLTYHTGEVAGAGKFVCTECGKAINFEKSGRIPPCSACKNTTFRRDFSTG